MPDAPYVFISYASADRERVLPIVDRLEQAGVKTWIDRDGIHGGANYAKVISDAVKEAPCSCWPPRPPSPHAMYGRSWRWAGASTARTPVVARSGRDSGRPGLLAGGLAVGGGARTGLKSGRRFAGLIRPLGITLTSSSQLPAAETLPRGAPAAGRHAEREQAQPGKPLDRMLAGQGGTVLVGGEAGIGKTTLVEDLSIEAEDAAPGPPGGGYDLTVTPPYGPGWKSSACTPDGRRLSLVACLHLRCGGTGGGWLAGDTLLWRSPTSSGRCGPVRSRRLWMTSTGSIRHRSISWYPGPADLQVSDLAGDYLPIRWTSPRDPLVTLLPLLVREAGAESIDVRGLDRIGHRTRFTQIFAGRATRGDWTIPRQHAEEPTVCERAFAHVGGSHVLAREERQLGARCTERVQVPQLLLQMI